MLAAVVAAEEIEPTDEELAEALAPTAEREGTSRRSCSSALRKAGALDALREDVATRKAMDLLAERAKPIALEPAQARRAAAGRAGERQKTGRQSSEPGQARTPGAAARRACAGRPLRDRSDRHRRLLDSPHRTGAERTRLRRQDSSRGSETKRGL